MPVDMPRNPARGKGRGPKGGAKGFRIGPYNGWVVLGGVVVAIVAGLYLRNRLGSGSSSSSTPAAPAVDTSGGGSGGGGAIPASPTDVTTPGLADALNGLTGLLGAGIPVNVSVAGLTPAAAPVATQDPGLGPVPASWGALPTTQPATGAAGPVSSPSQPVHSSMMGPPAPAGYTPPPPKIVIPISGKLATGQAVNIPAGASNVRTLANGSVTYTARNGNTIQVAPGKTPYVIKRA